MEPVLSPEPSDPFPLYLPRVLGAWLQGDGAGQILGDLWGGKERLQFFQRAPNSFSQFPLRGWRSPGR